MLATWGSIWSAGRPFLAHDEPAGHAVAACYLYAGGTEVAALTGDTALLDLLKTKWEKLAGRKMYVTGGTGTPHISKASAPTTICRTRKPTARLVHRWR